MAHEQHQSSRMQALDPILYPPTADLLHEETEFIDHFYQLITRSVKAPFAISVDGLWGTGKTTVMKLLQKKLHEEGGYSTFWFNPWEYRKTESVVLAFLQSLAAQHPDLVDQLPSKGVTVLKVLLKEGMRAALDVLTMKSVSLKDIEADLSEAEKAQKSSYDEYLDSIKVVKREFKTLIDMIGQKYHQHTVVVFFDDLDRCLPEDTIQLLEAVKNLFVTPGCNCIFICGIDTRVAKKFISKHYDGIEENFAINYFRKIFNLTISMPSRSRALSELLEKHIGELLGWNEAETKTLARMIATRGLQADMTSVRKFLNIVHNFYTFRHFNPAYTFSPDKDLIVHLLVLKEAWHPLYEELVLTALKNRSDYMGALVDLLLQIYPQAATEQKDYLRDFLVKAFPDTCLADELTKYPTLA